MGFIIDPTLHIVDTESHFFLTTRHINLQMKLDDAKRQKVYQLLERLKKQEDLTAPQGDPSQFEAKFIRLLIDKGIVTEQTESGAELEAPFQRLYGPTAFLQIVHQELKGSYRLDLESSESVLVRTESADGNSEWSVHIYRDRMYINTSEHRSDVEQEQLLPIHYEHAAYVFLDRCIGPGLAEGIGSMDTVFQINLSIYTNGVKPMISRDIDEDNFLDSIWCDPRLTGHRLILDDESFFPLVHAEYVMQGEGNVISSLGFDQRDAIRNLLFLLQNMRGYAPNGINICIRGKGEDTYELDQDSFLLKMIGIYFQEEGLMLNVINDQKELVSRRGSLMADNRDYCANSLLLSMFYSQLRRGGTPTYDHDVIRA